MTILLRAGFIGVGLLFVVGCRDDKQPKFGELHPVKGVVLSGDTPIKSGSVRFLPQPDNPDFLINSEIGPDGTFQLATVRTTDRSGERRAGAPPGKYKVTFNPAIADQTAGFREPVTLPTVFTVEAKANDLKIVLPKK